MSKSIKISPEHGLNPMIPTCFWCGKQKNEIALMGMLPKDAKAPHSAVLDYEPCDECRAEMDRGITLIGVVQDPMLDGRPAISKGFYPTGRWAVVSPDGIRSVMTEEQADRTIESGRALVEDSVLAAIMPSE